VGLALLAAVMVEALAGASRRATRGSGPRPRTAMDLAVVAWVIAAILSTVAGVSPRLGLFGEIEQREGLLTTLALAGLYAGARRSHLEPAHARRTLSLVLACAAFAAAYAVIQLAGLDPLAWANAPIYPAGGAGALRPFGTLGNPILLGNLLAAVLAAGVARLACGGGDAWRLSPLVALAATAIAATLSRGAWLAAAAGVGAALAGTLARGGPYAARRAGLALVAAATPAVLWSALALRAPLMARLAEGSHAEAVSAPARAEIARGAIALWRSHPWLGTGPDTFGLTFPGVQSAAFWRTEWLGVPVHAHSAALQVLATLGTAGALAGLAWLVVLGVALASAWRRAREERGEVIAIGAALLSLVVAGAINPVGIAGAALFVTLSALAAGGGGSARVSERDSRGARLLALTAGLAVAVAVASATAREMDALAAAGRARSALEQATVAEQDERGRLCALAARQAAQAAARAPNEDELWRLECDAELAHAGAAVARHDLGAADSVAASAENAARRALGLEPRRASNHQRLANALVMRARIVAAAAPGALASALADSADAVFGEACRLALADGLILVDQARGQLLLRRPERALATAGRIAALYPGAATGHALEAAALISLGRGGEARAALLRARAARWEDGTEPERRAVEGLLRAFDRADSTR